LLIRHSKYKKYTLQTAFSAILPTGFGIDNPLILCNMIFRYSSKNSTFYLQVSEDVVIDELGKKTNGYTGSDLREFCRYAALNCLRRQVIDMDCATVDG